MAEGSQEGLREVPASEILEKIKNGEPVEYKGILIKGNIDISMLNLPKNESGRFIIASRVCIVDSTFNGEADFSKSQFSKVTLFSGVEFSEDVDFFESQFSEDADFSGSRFTEYADFSKSQFSKVTFFNGIQFREDADFSGVEFREDADFFGSKFKEDADFFGSQFNRDAYFKGSQFSGYADFRGSKFRIDADFSESRFNNIADFFGSLFCNSTYFKGTLFSKATDFRGAQFNGEVLTFEGAVFKNSKSQEDACRRAKRVLEESGRVDEADRHYFLEMEGKRIQNTVNPSDILNNYFDYEMLLFGDFPITTIPSIASCIKYNVFENMFVRGIFKYGTDPYRVIESWFLIVFILGFIYLLGQGVEKSGQSISFFEYFYFSIITAATPGYGGYTPKPGIYTILAGAEAIFGVFMWGAFITTFTRKYMR